VRGSEEGVKLEGWEKRGRGRCRYVKAAEVELKEDQVGRKKSGETVEARQPYSVVMAELVGGR